MDEWIKQVLSNKPIVEQLLSGADKTSILSQYDEQKVEEIKICADFLAHKDEKYMQVADLVDEYQAEAGHHPKFGQ